jgi:hypothetical protein
MLVLVQARLLPVPVPVPVLVLVLARLLPVLALLAAVPVLPALGPNPPMGRSSEPTRPNCQSKTLTSQN